MDVGSNCLMRAFLSHVPNNHLDACLDTCSCASGHVAGHADEQTRRQATAPRCLCIWRDPCARFGSATEQRRWHPRDAFNSSCSRPNYVRASAQQAAGTNAGLGDGVRTRFAGALRNAKNQGTVGCFRSRCWQFVADGFEADEDHLLRAAILGNFNSMAIVGDLLVNIYNNLILDERDFDMDAIPFFDAIDEMQRGIGDIADSALDIDTQEFWDAIKDISSALGKFNRLPVEQFWKIYDGVRDISEDGADKELVIQVLGGPRVKK